MIALASSVFVASVLGSAHCVGMCGAFACVAADGHSRGPTPRRSEVVGTAAYSAGRLVGYATLGAVAGAAGSGFDRLGTVAGIPRPAALLAGTLLIVWGVATLLSLRGVRIPALAAPTFLASGVARAVRRVRALADLPRGAALGALSAALPCGWLYAFVVTAAASGSAVGGATVMAAFWLGTVPAMAAFALGAQRLLGPVRRRLPVVSAAVMIVIGALTAVGRIGSGVALAPERDRDVNTGQNSAHAHP